jgi:hypothetical protein
MTELEKTILKKTILREMINLKQAEAVTEAQAAGQEVVDWIQKINEAEAKKRGSSIKLFEGTGDWKSDLLDAIYETVPDVGEKRTPARDYCTHTIGEWATTTQAAKNTNAVRNEYIAVLNAVLGDFALEAAVRHNQASIPQEPAPLVVQHGAAAHRPSHRRLSAPRHSSTNRHWSRYVVFVVVLCCAVALEKQTNII